jgi:hypothetical protein
MRAGFARNVVLKRFGNSHIICSPLVCFSSVSVPSGVECALRAATLTDFNASVLLITHQLNPKACVDLMQKAIELKNVNDPKIRGRISRDVVRLISDAVLPGLSELSASDLMTLVRGVSDNAKCLDEFLMFKIARESMKRLEEFAVTDLVEMAKAYCTRELDDDELLEAISKRITADPGVTFPQLVGVLRSLSKVILRDEALIYKTIQSMPIAKSLWEKDAISLLIALAELDVKQSETFEILWEKFDLRKQSISHDDEYNIIFSHCWFPNRSTSSLQRIISRASKQNRIKKRLQLLSDCMHYNLIPGGHFEDIPQPSKPAIWPRGKARINWDRTMVDEIGSVSSGLHLEVASVLQTMGYETFLEVPASSFIIDTVVRKTSN